MSPDAASLASDLLTHVYGTARLLIDLGRPVAEIKSVALETHRAGLRGIADASVELATEVADGCRRSIRDLLATLDDPADDAKAQALAELVVRGIGPVRAGRFKT